jgi:hypothetical protein
MNILLAKLNNSNNLSSIIGCYQEYFIFETKDEHTYLYLDTKVLKKYLRDGIDIKYRKHIFQFLKFNKIDNSCYKFLCNIDKINLDNDNIEPIINLSNKIIKKKNKFTISEKNIIKLDNKFYADTDLSRFFYTKKNNTYYFSGIVINYNNPLENKISSIESILYFMKDSIIQDKTKDKLHYNTKCNLILTEDKNISLWCSIIKKYMPNSKFEILSISDIGVGGYKEASASIKGPNVFSKLKFESGVHSALL